MSAYIRITNRYICTSSLPNWAQNTITTWPTKIEILMLHWINSIMQNNKCIFTKLNAVFILTTANHATTEYFLIATHAIDTNSSTSLVPMRAHTHVSSSVKEVFDIVDVNYIIRTIYFVIITLLQQLILSQTPDQFSKLLCSTAVP